MNQNQKSNPLEFIKDCRGLSGPILFAMDSESIPGKTICHFVRMETQVFDDDAEIPNFVQLSKDADPRCEALAESYLAGANKLIQSMLGVMSEMMTGISGVLHLKVAVGTQALRIQLARSLTMAATLLNTGSEKKVADPGKGS